MAIGEKSRVCEPPTSPSCARVARCAPGVPTLTDTITHGSVEASCQAQPAAAVRADLLRSGNRSSSLQTLRTWAVLPKTRRRAPRLHAATTPRARAATPPLSSQGRSCAVLVLVSARVLGRPADCDPNRARPCHVCECAHRRAGHLGRTNVHPSSDSFARPTRQEAGLHYLGCLGCAVAVRLIRAAATSHLVAHLSGRRQVFAARLPPVSSYLPALTICPRLLRQSGPDVFNFVTANTAAVPK